MYGTGAGHEVGKSRGVKHGKQYRWSESRLQLVPTLIRAKPFRSDNGRRPLLASLPTNIIAATYSDYRRFGRKVNDALRSAPMVVALFVVLFVVLFVAETTTRRRSI
jgi:hypothetical protein